MSIYNDITQNSINNFYNQLSYMVNNSVNRFVFIENKWYFINRLYNKIKI